MGATCRRTERRICTLACNGQLWLQGLGGREGGERYARGLGMSGGASDGGLEEVGARDIAFGGVTMVVTVVLR